MGCLQERCSRVSVHVVMLQQSLTCSKARQKCTGQQHANTFKFAVVGRAEKVGPISRPSGPPPGARLISLVELLELLSRNSMLTMSAPDLHTRFLKDPTAQPKTEWLLNLAFPCPKFRRVVSGSWYSGIQPFVSLMQDMRGTWGCSASPNSQRGDAVSWGCTTL